MKTNLLCLAYAWAAIALAQAQTPGLEVIHSFGNYPNGASPYGTLARGSDGSLYGTTYSGGAADLGVVFRLDTSGQYKILYNFKGGTDGANPYAGVAIGPDGSLYGTAYQGGPANSGVVYKLDSSGSETVLYSFTGGADGGFPYAGVIFDSAGNLYGTTLSGGTKYSECGVHGCGVVYKVTPSGEETVLYAFQGQADGASPQAGVIADAAGNLYGTTSNGGSARCNRDKGCGVVYKIDASGNETVLYTFTGGTDGTGPAGGVIADAAGNLYGTADSGGAPPCRCGVIYELSPAGQETVLYSFMGADDGRDPFTGLTRDAAGNLYGATESDGATGVGTVYKLDTTGVLTVLYGFPGGPDQTVLNTAVVVDPAGNVYGTTVYRVVSSVTGVIYQLEPNGQPKTLYTYLPAPGGTYANMPVVRDSDGNLYGTTSNGGAENAGVVYKLDATGQETVLHTFTGGADGGYPQAGVILDSAGNLYGTTYYGGQPGCGYSELGCGVVYKLDPSGHQTILHTFTNGVDGALPEVGLTFDSAGNLYGTAAEGGAAQAGVIFKIDPTGQFTVVYSFPGADGGTGPAGFIRDPAGNFYGVTIVGGAGAGGLVYKVDSSGHETVLSNFEMEGNGAGGPTGAYLYGSVALDSDGNFYGTAWGGGDMNGAAGGCQGFGCGVVYRVAPSGKFTLLYAFTGGADGGMPLGGVVLDRAGNLYGTTEFGGFGSLCNPLDFDPGCGVVFKVDPSGNETVLHRFSITDGSFPSADLTIGQDGNLYGTTSGGGAANGGVVFKLALE